MINHYVNLLKDLLDQTRVPAEDKRQFFQALSKVAREVRSQMKVNQQLEFQLHEAQVKLGEQLKLQHELQGRKVILKQDTSKCLKLPSSSAKTYGKKLQQINQILKRSQSSARDQL